MHRRMTFLAVVLGLLGGAAAGLGGYTFIYAKGASYFTNDPAACANCHVMQDHYDAWLKAGHHAVAVCNDCHTPHDFFGKYTVKGINGFNHSLAFTTGRFHEPLQATKMNKTVAENACRRCHAAMVRCIDVGTRAEDALACVRCHDSVGHLR